MKFLYLLLTVFACNLHLEAQKTLFDACGNKATTLEAVQKLIDNRADLNAQDNQGRTALRYVCNQDKPVHFEILKYLLQAGADVNAKDNNGVMVLERAIAKNKYYYALELIKYGALVKPCTAATQNFYNKLLLDACGYGLFRAVQQIINAGADLTSVNSQGETLLHLAARSGNFNLVCYLVNVGFDMTQRVGLVNFSPLDCAAFHGHAQLANYFLGSKKFDEQDCQKALKHAKSSSHQTANVQKLLQTK